MRFGPLAVGNPGGGCRWSGAGTVTASAIQDQPQDAQSITADLNRQQAQPRPAPVESAPAGSPAPSQPVPVSPPVPDEQLAQAGEKLDDEAAREDVAEARPDPTPAEPGRRTRQKTAIVHAVNKTTAETMTFAVEVGGRSVRFSENLIVSARACERSAADEVEEDYIAYLEVGLVPRGVLRQTMARQIFRGWMFASSPAVNALEHPLYDVWVVGCRA
ncbi:MAG: DUF2155 domain-containing protein [Brevundimonas sp.]|nr:MAG: DUF2155 domain-containing protein [Brevundimonas sp.]